jgi:hypothetical protein
MDPQHKNTIIPSNPKPYEKGETATNSECTRKMENGFTT